MDLANLAEYLKSTEFSLFLGAGCSVPGGGPTSKELLDNIRQKYAEVGEEGDFFNAFDVILPDDTERAATEEFLRSVLMSVTPNEDHRYLFSLPLRAVITTNYDHIPDLIDTTLDKNRTIITLVGPKPKVDIRKEDHLYCFKLLGDIAFFYPHEGHMILTNTDRRRAYSRQAEFFRLFGDLARSGIVVYLGYSFEDELVFDILSDMLFETKNFPHRGFAIIPNKPSEQVLQGLKKCNIEWVEGTLEKFVVECKRTFGEIPKSCSVSIYPIKVHGKIIDLDRATFSNIRGKMKIAHQGLFSSNYADPKSFFEGKDQSFVPFQKGWDFPRNWKLEYCQDKLDPRKLANIQKLVDSRSMTGNPADNLVYVLTGAAGSGKSTVARRIAYEWYLKGNPVFFLEPTNVFLDATAIENLLDEIWAKYRKQEKPDEVLKELRHLIICDNGSLVLSQIGQLADHLMSTGKPVDILIVDRSSELPIDLLKEEAEVDAIMILRDTISSDERKAFLEHFERMGVLPDLSALRYNLDDPRINTSFFALMYTAIREVQTSIQDIIVREFESKNPEIQRLYATVSLIQSFGLAPYYTIMTKTSGLDFESISAMMKSGPLKEVLNFNDEEQAFEANHRIVADIIRKHVFSTTDLLKNGLSTVISVVTDGNIAEMTLLHKMLIDCSEIGSQLSPTQIEDLFNAAIGRIRTRPLLLHLARWQLRLKRYDECRISLAEAHRTHHPSFPEAQHHIFDAEGRLELTIGREALSKRDEEKAWTHLEEAEGAFIRAKVDPIATPHPYFGLSQTYAEMAKLQKDRPSTMTALILALNNLQELKNNSPEWFSLTHPLELEMTIFAKLKGSGFNEVDAASLFERAHNANGYAFLAGEKAESGDLKEALRLVDEGLKRDKRSIWLIRTRVELLKKLCPEDLDEMYDTLTMYRQVSDRTYDLQLAFELAKLQFVSEEWEPSKSTFSELKSKSKGYRNRLIPSPRDRWLENGKPKVFLGVIARPPTIEEWGELRSTVPPIPVLIPVDHKQMGYERWSKDERVAFEIVFNMVGPQASNVKER
jgi:tetratricopeptide (TPR) repeat protein